MVSISLKRTSLKKGKVQMISLYIILLIGSFLVGWWEGGDITFFVFALILFSPGVMDEIRERRKVKR